MGDITQPHRRVSNTAHEEILAEGHPIINQ